MAKTQTQARITGKVLVYIALIILALWMLIPLLLMLNASFLTEAEFNDNPIQFSFFGKDIATLFVNYMDAFERLCVIERFFKTLGMALISSVLGVVITLLAAFPISRNYFRGSNKVYIFLLASMFFPSSLVGLIFVMQGLNVYDSPISLIILWMSGGLASHIFMLVGFIRSVPRDLDEAAFMDGCSYFKYVFVIALPLLKPIISTLFVLRMIGAWNDFMNPYIFLTTDDWRTLSTGLFYYKGNYGSEWYSICAATTIVALPMVIVYCFFQKFIIEGMTAGALKG